MTLDTTLDAGQPMPWLFELAADIADESVGALDDDPGAITRSLSTAVDLFSLPAVVVSFDTTVEADALGCTVTADNVEGIIKTADDAFDIDIGAVTDSKRVTARLDATERLTSTSEAAILGGVTGPAQLAEQLLSEESAATDTREEAILTAGDVCVELANAYLNAGAHGVAVLEPGGLDAPLYEEAVEPVVNTLDHYEADGVVVTDTLDMTDISTAESAGFDIITGFVEDREQAVNATKESDISLGVGVPRETFEKGPGAVATFCETVPTDAGISSQWTVPRGTPPEAIHELMGSL